MHIERIPGIPPRRSGEGISIPFSLVKDDQHIQDIYIAVTSEEGRKMCTQLYQLLDTRRVLKSSSRCTGLSWPPPSSTEMQLLPSGRSCDAVGVRRETAEAAAVQRHGDRGPARALPYWLVEPGSAAMEAAPRISRVRSVPLPCK